MTEPPGAAWLTGRFPLLDAKRRRPARQYPKPFLNSRPLTFPSGYGPLARGRGAAWFASTSTACVSSSSTTTPTCGASCARCCTASARAKSTRRKTAPPGLEAFTHYIPDIVITDWAMPIFDGLELTQMIRQPGANANPYVADHHADRPFREEARDARRAMPASPNSSPSRSRPRRSISASSTSSPTRGRSSRPRPISVPTAAATSIRTMSGRNGARAARRTSSARPPLLEKVRTPG